MSNPTTPFNWQMPTATDLVTDLPADFEVFGQAVATSMGDLLGGTTGQILSKATNTDMDFTWVSANPGDITGVTATTPLTGGGTSGDVTVGIQDALTTQKGAVQLSDSTSTTSSILAATPTAVKSAYDLANGAIAKSTLTTAGDVLYRNATVPVRLGIGTANQVLTVNAGATAPEWKTPAGGGKVLQVVSATYSTQTSTGSNTFIDSGLTASITPTLNTSKVLVLTMQFAGCYTTSNYTSNYVKLMRGATDLTTNANPALFYGGATFSTNELDAVVTLTYLDSPATTSSTTYKTQFKQGNTGTAIINSNGALSSIILMEIGA